jgi:hypothetical protein
MDNFELADAWAFHMLENDYDKLGTPEDDNYDYDDEDSDDFFDEDCYPSYLRSKELKPLVETLKKCIRAEYKNKIELLEDENKKLSEFRAEYDTYQTALADLERKFNENMETLKNKSFKRFVKDFFEDGYIVTNEYVYDMFDKCDRCNNNRQIEFTSPTGKHLTESCPCKQCVCQYKPTKIGTYEVVDRFGDGVRIFTDTSSDGDRVELTDHTYYSGEDFNELIQLETKPGTSYSGGKTPKFMHIIFRSREECQAFCDFINEIKYNEACGEYLTSLCSIDGIECTDEVVNDFMNGIYIGKKLFTPKFYTKNTANK